MTILINNHKHHKAPNCKKTIQGFLEEKPPEEKFLLLFLLLSFHSN